MSSAMRESEESVLATAEAAVSETTSSQDTPQADGCIQPEKLVSEIPQDPYPLPEELELEWSPIDVVNRSELRELQIFLSENYVEDEDNGAFRLHYSADCLRWALCPPGYHKDWHIAVRTRATNKIVAFASSVPVTVCVRASVLKARELNFLCVHKTMRGKRLCPLLLKEATRRGHQKGVNYALYTAGAKLPNPVATCQYWHCSINIPKLVDVGFYEVPSGKTIESLVKDHSIPDREVLVKGLREMEERDVPDAAALYDSYMDRFSLTFRYTLEELKHHLMASQIGEPLEERFLWTYVVENSESHRITDFFSFFSLPYTVLGPNSGEHKRVEIAQLYLYATDVALSEDTDTLLKDRLTQLMEDALLIVKRENFDVFNAVSLMDNLEFMRDLKFLRGTGLLNYYLDNWRTSPLAGMNAVGDVPAGRGVGVVML